jgi:hypothetical protein
LLKIEVVFHFEKIEVVFHLPKIEVVFHLLKIEVVFQFGSYDPLIGLLGQHSLNMLENKISQVGVAGSHEDKVYSAFKPWLT